MTENNKATPETPDNAASRRAAVVINPMKSPGKSFRASFFRLCETQGWAEPLWLETTKEDTGIGQAREALDAGVDVVIAAGGDGTVRCVAEVPRADWDRRHIRGAYSQLAAEGARLVRPEQQPCRRAH